MIEQMLHLCKWTLSKCANGHSTVHTPHTPHCKQTNTKHSLHRNDQWALLIAHRVIWALLVFVQAATTDVATNRVVYWKQWRERVTKLESTVVISILLDVSHTRFISTLFDYFASRSTSHLQVHHPQVHQAPLPSITKQVSPRNPIAALSHLLGWHLKNILSRFEFHIFHEAYQLDPHI